MPKIIGSKKDHPLQQFLKTYIKKKIKCCHIINCRPYVLIFFMGTITPPGQIDHWWTMAGGSSISSPLAERSPGRSAAACGRGWMQPPLPPAASKEPERSEGRGLAGRMPCPSTEGRRMGCRRREDRSEEVAGLRKMEHKGREQAGGRKELVGIGPLPQIGSGSSWRKSGSERRQN